MPAILANSTFEVTPKITYTKIHVKITSTMIAPPAFNPIADCSSKPFAPITLMLSPSLKDVINFNTAPPQIAPAT